MSKVAVIAGVPVDIMGMSQALDCIEGYIASGKPHQVATVNADFVVKAWEDPELRHILHSADLLTADGMPLVWGAKLLGVQLEDRVTGVDLVAAMAERGARLGWRFYLLGGREGVAARAAEVMKERYPGLQIVGIDSPPLASTVEMPVEIVERVVQAHPDVLLVAFGNPKQDKWIHMHLQELRVPVSIGIGGTLDFISGETRRAPAWMQRSGLEWLYRLLQEPRRLWKRYAVDMVQFSRLFWIQYWSQRDGGRRFVDAAEPAARIEPAAQAVPQPAPLDNRLAHAGRLTADNAQQLSQQVQVMLASRDWQALPGGTAEILLDLSETTFIDSSGLGMLVQATRQARSQGVDLRLWGLQPQVQATIQLLRLDAFLTLGDSPSAAPGRAEQASELVKSEPGAAVLRLPRRLEISNVSRVLMAFSTDPECAGLQHWILDFSDTRFVDSASIAALLSLQKEAKVKGCQLELAAVGREVRQAFDLAGAGNKFVWIKSASLTNLEKAQ